MRKISFLWTLIICLLAGLPGGVSAEETKNALKMEELTIQVLPEYSYHPKAKNEDHPPLLVGYHGALMNNTDQPQKGQIEIPLPTNDKNFKLGFVADYSTDLTEMYEIEYKLDKELGTISWETSEEIQPQEIYKFVIEYYTDNIKVSDDKKTLEYQFTSFADIGLMNLIFVEPLKTEKFTLEPANATHQKNSYNLNMFLYQTQGMKIGEEKTVNLEYVRQDDRTTAKIMEEMAASPDEKQVAKKNKETLNIWMVVGVIGGITLVASGLLFYLLKKRTKKNNEDPKKKEPEEDLNIKKAKLRKMLMEESITEEEYNELLKRLGGK